MTRGQAVIHSPKMPERDIVKAIIDWLNTIPHCRAYRRNTGAAVSTYKGRKRLIRYNRKGQSDIWFVLRGIHGEIEVKRQGERPTAEQEAWIAEIRAARGIAFWCDSFDDCVREIPNQFDGLGVFWNDSWNPQ